MKPIYFFVGAVVLFTSSCNQQPQWSQADLNEEIKLITIEEGPVLGYSNNSGVTILVVDQLPFKDLNKNGSLDPYEDWRLSVEERAQDLASKMSEEHIAGLMLYSGHQNVPAGSAGYFRGTYNGKTFEESGAKASDLTDQQKKFLTEDNLRHVLVVGVESPAVAAEWNNKVQTHVEGLGLGIPSNNSSDPRNGARSDAEYNAGSGGTISQWPEEIGLSATFDPSITEQFGRIASQEYRALGVTTALSPQIDLATEPRWNRF
jgi:beta-glucosidase